MNPRTLAKLGWAGIVAAVTAVASVALMLAWPPQVPPGAVSYPFTPDGFRTIETWFFVHHFLLAAVTFGFARSEGVGPKRYARIAAWSALVGVVGLTCMELFATRFAEWDMKAANEGAMGAGYGMTSTLVGLSMLVAGAGVLRA